MKYRSKLPLMSAACLVLALSACGGDSYKEATMPKDPNIGGPITGQPTIIDTFTKFVMGLLVSAPDNSEPVSIASNDATMPENTEPEPVTN
jgi:hypothetical protein